MFNTLKEYKIFKAALKEHQAVKLQTEQMAARNEKLKIALAGSSLVRSMDDKIKDCEMRMEALANKSLLLKLLCMVGF